jgi:hypothetical protein
MELLTGVCGLARAGKDTFARGLVRQGYTRLAFADALKEATAHIANEPSWLYFDDDQKEAFTPALGMTRRRALQLLGTSVRETLGPDTWVRRALNKWVADGKRPTVISDVRYPNEAEAIRALGGTVVRIVRLGAGLAGEAGQHVSEAGIPDDLVDIVIPNNEGIGDLYVQAQLLAERMARLKTGQVQL